MSGDVQPRKRGKDKSKRRRAEDSDAKAAEQLARKMSTLNDGEDEDAPKVSGVQSVNMGPDDILLHVQKDDHGTGGHWCAKIFFFSLMAILVGLVGLILLENRGISDLDTPLSESRFAEYLDGWVEEKRESHDEHDIIESLHELDNNDHDEPFAEEEDHDSESHDEEHDDEDDDHDDDDDHDEEDEDGHEDDEDEHEENGVADSKAEDEDGEENDADDNSPEVDEDKKYNNDEDDDGEDVDAGGDDENDSAPEQDATAEVEQDDDQDDDDKNGDDDDARTTESNEVDEADDENKSGENDSNVAADPNDSDPFDEEDDNEASFEEVIDNDEGEDIHLQKLANKEDPAAAGESDGDDDQPDKSSSVTVKIGVGLALVVVAYLVLARKAQTSETDEESVAEPHEESLSNAYKRRMTLVSKEEPLPDEANEEEGLNRYKEQSIDELEKELRRANEQLAESPESSLKHFDALLAKNGNDFVAQYGRAKALDELASMRKDNRLLRQAIAACERLVMQLGVGLPDNVFRAMGDRCVEQMRFIGLTLRAVTVHNKLIERFPDDRQVYNQLSVTYLMANKLDDAKIVLHNTLLRWRSDGFALVHYGFVLKNLDNDLNGAVQFLTEGIASGDNGTVDGRFFFALGDSLQRLGRLDEARQVYRHGTRLKLFRSEFQRSLYNVDRLRSQPFWSKEETRVADQLDALTANWRRVRDEGLAVLGEDGYFIDETENLRDKGFWQQFDLFTRGQRVAGHCEKTPFTCKLIETFSAARQCTRGQVKFSVMHPGTHVWPHCGPTNCRLRAHLGLHVPADTFLRVAEETRSWREGELLIFDDSFEHEVWHNGTSVRLVLIVDIWHPDLTSNERQTLPPI